MTTNEERNYLRLQLFSIDLSTEVVRDYAKRNLYGTHSTFKTFLKTNQHDIYHMWSPGIDCCKCIVGGPGKGKHGRFSQGQLETMYDMSGTINCRHTKRDKGGKVIETCCCNIIAVKDCSLDDIDISTICPLLLTFGNPSSQIYFWITEIRAVRNKLCHAPAIKHFDDIEFNTLWRRLEQAVCGIAKNIQPNGFVMNMVNRQIYLMKNANPSTAEIKTLNGQLKLDIEQIITEQSSVQSESITELQNNISELSNQNSNLTQCMNIVLSKLDMLEELALNFKFGRSMINVVGEKPEACRHDKEVTRKRKHDN